MRMFRFAILAIAMISASVILLACGGAPTPVPPTAAPIAVPPTTVPTTAPTAVLPTAAPTAAPTTVPAASGSASAAQDAFKKFAGVKNFSLQGKVSSSPAFFSMPYSPGPKDDPETVMIVSVDGATRGADMQYKLEGVLASFVGALIGFDPASSNLEMAKLGDKLYMRGVLQGQSEPKWYLLPDEQASSMSFEPQDIVKTVVDSDFSKAAFTKTGTASVDNQTCQVYTGDRAAFDAVLPNLEQQAGLNTENIDATKLDSYEFTIVVCPDGHIHRITYNFAGPVKTKPSDKAKFSYDVNVSGFDATSALQAPADAQPFPATTNALPTSEPTVAPVETTAPTGSFDSLDGEWEGTSSTESPIQFTVQGDKITYANLNYAYSKGGCSASGAFGSSPDASAIQDKKFTVLMTDRDGMKFVFAGTFETNASASGTLDIEGKTFCGDINSSVTWTAKHKASSESDDDTAEPTEQATPDATMEMPALPTLIPPAVPTTQLPNSGGSTVVEKMFNALNQGDVNTALGFAEPTVIFNIGSMSGIGTDALRSYLQTAAAAGTKYTVSDVEDLGGIVSFKLKVSGALSGDYAQSSAIVNNGKISILTIQ